MDNLYKIGEVEKITGIPQRQIKYFLEQNFIVPSEKKVQGKKETWLYNERDIQKIQQIKLYKDLDYSNKSIREMQDNPDFDWNLALENQIKELREKKLHLENLLLAAESMRFINDLEKNFVNHDISDFHGDIDKGVVSLFKLDEVDQGFEEMGESLKSTYNEENMEKFLEFLKKWKNVQQYDAKSNEFQKFLEEFFIDFRIKFSSADSPELNAYFVDYALFCLRFFNSIGINRLCDLILNKTDSFSFLENALEKFRERVRNKEWIK